MIKSHFGELAALMTAVFWTITALSFESAGKKVGSLTVNLIRLVIGFVLLSLFAWLTRGFFLPVDASANTWFWLSASGLIGFVMGDLFLFKAFVVIGARISMLIMALVPPLAALIGWLVLGEILTGQNFVGMGLTLSGIALVVLGRPNQSNRRQRVNFSYPVLGLLLAFGGAVGQAIGLVLSKLGMKAYNAFAATQIRILAGILGFSVLFFILKRWPQVFKALKHRGGMIGISVGALFGPFLGVSFSLLAIQNTSTGIASTIMSIVPVLIIAPAVIIFKEKVTLKEIIGAIVSVVGVALFFL